MGCRVEAQLRDFERKVAMADDETKELLGTGAQILMGMSKPSSPSGAGKENANGSTPPTS